MQLIIKHTFIALILFGSAVSFAGGSTSSKSACESDKIPVRVPTLSSIERGLPVYHSFHEYENLYDLKCVYPSQRFILISEKEDYLYLDIRSLENSRRALNPYPATRDFLMESGD